ncbi:EamA family transporter RarD [uncultured Brevundimonas sp.]|uniref:EamA family transporter RarD n=1 Tax=uncultured Brevundimonas sp. TaxID=213418 RepID=UPI0030EE44B6
MTQSTPDSARAALIAGVGCYVLWGLSPLIYQPMGAAGADAWEIMAHRAVWGVIWAAGLVLLAGQSAQVRRVLADWKTLRWLIASTFLIALNWLLFVWSVNHGHTLETSLGYYLNPLLNMALGAWLFRERISRAGLIAIALAAVGVILQGVALGRLPVISLTLAVSFAAYGVIRKQVKAEAQTGLLVECLLMAPLGLAWLVWLSLHGTGHFGATPAATFWLAMAGPITVGPLVLFAWAARRLPLSTIGFLQFIAPTLSFFIGVAQGEHFTWLRGVSFGFIWIGAAVFLWAAWSRAQAARSALKSQAEPV